uniref:GH18 domain-containing protein n=1 Tax=Clastoptera arizonana TaxID=38151 RepID=A0A1B6EG91_9HEMI
MAWEDTKKATSFKTSYPHLKVLLTVGGWTEGSKNFSLIASTANSRKIFVESVVKLLREHNFDGLDINWQHPGQRGGDPKDKSTFPLLLKDLKEEFNKHNLLLTILINGKKFHLDAGIDFQAVTQHVDWINYITYAFNGPWENKTACSSPMRSKDQNNVVSFANILY